MHTLDIAPLRSESPLQKCSGMACVLKGFQFYLHTHTFIHNRNGGGGGGGGDGGGGGVNVM